MHSAMLSIYEARSKVRVRRKLRTARSALRSSRRHRGGGGGSGTKMRVQDAIQLIGQGRRYHAIVLTILALNFMFISLHIFSDLFLRLEPRHHCRLPENGTREQWIPYKREKGKFSSCYIYSEPLTDQEIYKYHPLYFDNQPPKPHDIVEREITSSEQNLALDDTDEAEDTSPSEYKREKLRCSEFEYQDTHGSTMITEWGLSCDKDRRLHASTVICVAMLLGGIMFAPFVDKLGRKTLLMMCCVQNTLLAIGVTFVGDFNSYLVLRFLARLYIEGVEVGVLVLAVELVPAKNRPLAPFMLFVAYSLGHCLLPVLAYFFKSWRYFQLTIALGSAVLIPITSLIVPESLNWLVSSGRHKEAEKIIRRAARLNGLQLPDNFSLDEMDDQDKTDDKKEPAGSQAAHRLQRRVTQMNGHGRSKQGAGDFMQHEIHAHLGHWSKLADMMKNHQLRKHFCIVSYVWAVVGFLYFGLTTSTMESKGNVYLNYGLSGVVMIPACVSVFLILRRFGRKKPIMAMLFGCGLSVIGSTLCPLQSADGTDLYPLYLLLKMLSKYTTFSALVSIRLLIIEIFPTPVRGSLVGLTAMFGLLGSGLGYYYSVMLAFSRYVGVAAGCLALVAALLCRLLPETSNRPLPDTIHDVMEAYRDVFVNMLSMMGGVGGGPDGSGSGGGGQAENGRAAKGSQRKRASVQKAPLAEPEEHAAMLTDREQPSGSRRASKAPAWTPDV
ncbi:solute carrier family 22 member 8-like isoform X2 [Amphibalanus amphitrite]|uniref:solute carrier family 22 member 8-like isoform X2 n=1 Tax=Amphibalanus amphitrite TaxID=1232801 RepID=UPI001C90A612|nr:solute carrier family 22 member 8-like isoform X2 [Amphibalanus amphitrite]